MSISVLPPPQISQFELSRLVALLNQQRQLQRQIDALADGIFQRLDRGFEVVPGSLSASIGERRRPSQHTRFLLVNGNRVSQS